MGDVLRTIHEDMVNHPGVIRPVHPGLLSLAAELMTGLEIDLNAPLFPEEE